MNTIKHADPKTVIIMISYNEKKPMTVTVKKLADSMKLPPYRNMPRCSMAHALPVTMTHDNNNNHTIIV
jgi:hypothetical protein